MAGIGNNLYPPIFEKSYAPAFVSGQGCVIYFTLSPYNSEGEIKFNCTQVIVQNQKTNQSVLNKTKYPSGIKITTMAKDLDSEDRYYIVLKNQDIEGGFVFNQYYKVQIRFTSALVTETPSSNSKLNVWLSKNLNNISQWSTSILIKPISKPIISISQFNFNTGATSLITTNNIIISGKVKPGNDKDYEKMKSYQIFIYDRNGSLLQDSGEKYFYDSNQILYNCKYNFQSGSFYSLKIKILTNNLYLMEENADFEVQYVAYTSLNANISGFMDNAQGCVVLTIKNEIASEIGTNIVIRRASSKENFLYWEDLYTTLIPSNSFLNLTWKDYTVESGVWYKYSVVKRNKNNYRSNAIQIKQPILANFEDIFLTTKDNQLKIRFNPQISNYSRVVSQSLVQTIGSQYPFIRRNGKVNYRTFSISGTISYFSDINQNLMHASKEQLYKENVYLYEEYNENNNITLYNDIIQEKVFRDKVLDFLYENNVKLYRSETQGNILVKLMNISLTPNTTLSRQIYDFTCTAYEIDEFNYENCLKYDIQDGGAFTEEESFFITRYSQIIMPSQDKYYAETKDLLNVESDGSYFGKENLLSGIINSKFKKLETESIQIEVNHLTYLKIQLTSPPYLINAGAGGKLTRATSENNNNIICSGHIVNINNESIIIGPEGIYELSGDNIHITNLSFEFANQQGVIDFQVVLEEKEKRKINEYQDYTHFSKIGQLWGDFNLKDNITTQTIYSKIINKYTYSNNINQEDQQVQGIKGLRITAMPGTVVYVKESEDTKYDKHVLNQTGVLEFFDDDTNIKGVYFEKPKLKEIDKETMISKGLASNEFYDSGEVITLNTFKNPKNNYIYYFAPVNLDKKLIKLTTEEKIIIETLQQEINSSQNPAEGDLYSSDLIQKKILGWKTNNEKAEELNSKTLGLKFGSFDKYIFYDGSWYKIKPKEEGEEDDGTITVDISNINAIIDYYCDILRKRY